MTTFLRIFVFYLIYSWKNVKVVYYYFLCFTDKKIYAQRDEVIHPRTGRQKVIKLAFTPR